MKSTALLIAGTLFGLAQVAAASPIPPGTRVDVRTDVTIDVRDADGRVYPGFVAHDVADRDGRVIIPRGAQAELIVRRFGPRDFAIDLESVTVNGQRFSIDTSDAGRVRRDGDNRWTGEFAGGGAVVGSILGAIAGGGKGAAIGAVAGGAAGASAAAMTRGERVYIPAESIMTFRLERPLDIYPDNGYDRDGNHYHRDWYPNGPPPPPLPPQ